MTATDYRRIALELLTEANLMRAPVEVLELAGQLGVRVLVRGDLPAKVAGFLYRGPVQDVVVVNGGHHPVRRRFTVAHELGHWALDADGIFFKGVHRAVARTTEEMMDAFAGALLMPETLVREELRWAATPEDLAQRFQVSRAAMRRRLSELALDSGGQAEDDGDRGDQPMNCRSLATCEDSQGMAE